MAVSDNVGRVIERYDYSAFGQRYRVATQSPLNPIGELFTRRGYTGHEEIEEMGLIHMNGRVYDPKLARFLSADPHVQLPDSTQGFNRYAYVQNNPLKYTDPSGFFLSGLWKAVGNMFSAMGSQLLAGLNSIARFMQTYGTTLFAIAITSIPGLNVVAAGFISGLISGGNLKSAVLGAIGAGMFMGLHTMAQGFTKVLAHGMAGGVMSKLSGGSFKAGFLSGGFTQAVSWSGAFNKLGSNTRTFGTRIKNAFAAATVGGVASVLGGGKFKNGAITGAFSRMFNDYLELKSLSDEFKDSIGEAYEMGKSGDIDGYIDKVKSGGDWDFKNRREYKGLENIEDFGNFAFGATGAAWADGYTGGGSNLYPDLTTNLLLRGAGAYQEYFQNYNPSDGSFYDNASPALSNYGDQSRDQMSIYSGSQYYFSRH